MNRERLIKKWLQSELSPEEKAAFDSLEDASFMEEIVQEAGRFRSDQMGSAPSFEDLENRLVEKPAKGRRGLALALKIAAVLVIGLGLLYVFKTSNEVEFKTELAQTTNLTLPDNSEVTLNERSSITYKPENWTKERTLSMEGEAFFDVEKGSRFVVQTAYGSVSVLGTEFNVRAQNEIFKVICYEGLVQVEYRGQVEKVPAGSALVVEDGKVLKTDVVLRKPIWINQMSVFENASLTAVFSELEKQYGITVVNQSTKDKLFTGAFENNNLENALSAIAQTMGLHFEVDDRQVIFKDETP